LSEEQCAGSCSTQWHQRFHSRPPAFSLVPPGTAVLKAVKILEQDGRLCEEQAKLANLNA